MSEIDKLKELMTLNANMNTLEIESRFEHIAQILFSKFAVKKVDKYFCSKILNSISIIRITRIS